jgi:hypothetical protein
MPTEPVRFAQIKQILDSLIQGHSWQRIRSVHHEPNFGWDCVDQLRSIVVRPDGPTGPAFQLVDMDLVNQGQGANTYLVHALREDDGVDFRGRMPFRPPPGRYATESEIQLIINWLNTGMPE